MNKLSTISGVTQSTRSNVVDGRNNSTTVFTLQKLCDGLGITVIDFFNDDLFKDREPEVTHIAGNLHDPIRALGRLGLKALERSANRIHSRAAAKAAHFCPD